MARVTFIQWKGTDVCMDLYCPQCHAQGHIDGYFFYYYRCSGCGQIYEVGTEVTLTPVSNIGDSDEACVLTDPQVTHA